MEAPDQTAPLGNAMTALTSGQMNESDVRDTIVRPLLHALGYEQGTRNNIRSELQLVYQKSSLGRKTKNDPVLRGRADYICEVVGVGRWVVEVKAPDKPISRDAIEQAHSYARHPDVNAEFFLLTNGMEFQLHRTSNLDTPVLAFEYPALRTNLPLLAQYLSPQAIEKRFLHPLSPRVSEAYDDVGIADGYGPQVRITGGMLLYRDLSASNPSLQKELNNSRGQRAIVNGGFAYRMNTGQIRADVLVTQPTALLDKLASLMALDHFVFDCAELHISAEIESPTVLTGQQVGSIPPGADFTGISSVPSGTRLLWPIHFTNDMRATGFVKGDRFVGTFSYETSYFLRQEEMPPPIFEVISGILGGASHTGWGDFDLALVPALRDDLASFLNRST